MFDTVWIKVTYIYAHPSVLFDTLWVKKRAQSSVMKGIVYAVNFERTCHVIHDTVYYKEMKQPF